MDDFHHHDQREIYDNHQHLEEVQRLDRERENFDRIRNNSIQNKLSKNKNSPSFFSLAGICFFALILFASLGGTGIELAFPLIALIIFILAPLFKFEEEE